MKITTNNFWDNKKRPNENAKIPYGYRASKEDPLVLEADDSIVVHVEQAMDYLDNGQSYREVATWLSETTGETISHQGIANIWKRARGDTSQRSKQLNARKRKTAPKTREDRELASLKKKQAAAKRSLTATKKKLEQLKGTDENLSSDSTPTHTFENRGVSDGLDFDAKPKDREVVFEPNPGPQTEFLSASEREVLYGGAAGGGKSYGLLADPLRYFANKNFNGLILRRTNDELRELIWKSQELYPKAYPGANGRRRRANGSSLQVPSFG